MSYRRRSRSRSREPERDVERDGAARAASYWTGEDASHAGASDVARSSFRHRSRSRSPVQRTDRHDVREAAGGVRARGDAGYSSSAGGAGGIRTGARVDDDLPGQRGSGGYSAASHSKHRADLGGADGGRVLAARSTTSRAVELPLPHMPSLSATGAVPDERFVDDRFVDEDEPSDEEADGGEHRGASATAGAAETAVLPEEPALMFEIPEGVDEEEAMARLMGFSSFSSTHGTHVEDNSKSAARGVARRVLELKYRQYLNRRGGHNRPLDAQKPIKRGG